MNRRQFLGWSGAVGTAVLATPAWSFWGKSMKKRENVLNSSLPEFEKWQLSEDGWRQRLSAEQFRILRQHGTERAGTSLLNDEKRAGLYLCAGCELPVYSSEHKFDSGTGWPSFYQPYKQSHVAELRDTSIPFMPRTEVLCARCGGHHGHVFEDGPQPTGLRYCINGLALTFQPAADA